MQFSPQLRTIVSVIATLIAVIAFLSPTAFPSYVPVSVSAAVISTCAFLNILMNALNGVLNLYSNSAPGPLAPGDPKVVVEATKLAALPSDARPSVVAAAKDAATEAIASH